MPATHPRPPTIDDHYTPPRDGCRDLWAEVIAQAVRDAGCVPRRDGSGSKQGATRHEQDEARVFLTARSGTWAQSRIDIADMIGLDADALLERVAPMIRMPEPVLPEPVVLAPVAPVRQPEPSKPRMTPEELSQFRREAGRRGAAATNAIRQAPPETVDANSPKLAEMERLWSEGVAAREIGRRLSVSHNSVIGHAHRRKWGARSSPLGQKAAR